MKKINASHGKITNTQWGTHIPGSNCSASLRNILKQCSIIAIEKWDLAVIIAVEIEVSIQEKGARTAQLQGVQRALEHAKGIGDGLGALISNVVVCAKQIITNMLKTIMK